MKIYKISEKTNKTNDLDFLDQLAKEENEIAENVTIEDAINKQYVISPQWKNSFPNLTWVKTKEFDELFKKDIGFYVGKGGSENSIGNRYNLFKYFLKTSNSPIEVSAVDISEHKVAFADGRHRYAVLRDLGMNKVPIALSNESLNFAQKHNLI